MNFGKFDETDLFHIENSKIYKDLGLGIKTVEFILKYDENSIVFLKQRKVVRTLPIVMNQRKKNRNLKNIICQNNKE